jgi:hypothetical protein
MPRRSRSSSTGRLVDPRPALPTASPGPPLTRGHRGEGCYEGSLSRSRPPPRFSCSPAPPSKPCRPTRYVSDWANPAPSVRRRRTAAIPATACGPARSRAPMAASSTALPLRTAATRAQPAPSMCRPLICGARPIRPAAEATGSPIRSSNSWSLSRSISASISGAVGAGNDGSPSLLLAARIRSHWLHARQART